MADVNFPVIDFSDFENRYAAIASQVLEASKNIGFFYIRNHNGPSADQFKRAFEMVMLTCYFVDYKILY